MATKKVLTMYGTQVGIMQDGDTIDPDLMPGFTFELGGMEPGIVSSFTSGEEGISRNVARADHNHDLAPHRHEGVLSGGQILHTSLIFGVDDDDHDEYIHVDGRREFIGIPSCAIAPTLGKHLSNKDYVDVAISHAVVASADKLTFPRHISISGDLTWDVEFDGTIDVTAVGTLKSSGATSGTYNSATEITPITVNDKGIITKTFTPITITPSWTSVTDIPQYVIDLEDHAVWNNKDSFVIDGIKTGWGVTDGGLRLSKVANESLIENTSGPLCIRQVANEMPIALQFSHGTTTETMLSALPNDGITLYHNNLVKFVTTNSGVIVSGTMEAGYITGANVTFGVDPGHTHTAYIPKSIGEKKSDLIVFSNVSTPNRLEVGTPGQILMADPTSELGIAWVDYLIMYYQHAGLTGSEYVGDVLSNLIVRKTTDNTQDLPQYTSNVGLISTSGYGSEHGDRVSTYSGIVAKQNSGNIWAGKFVSVIDTTAQDRTHAKGLEIRCDNNKIDMGEDEGPDTNPISSFIGLDVTSNATKNMTSGIRVSKSGLGTWNRGISVYDAHQASFITYADSHYGISLEGNHIRSGLCVKGGCGYGIDTSAMTGPYAMRMHYDQSIMFTNEITHNEYVLLEADRANIIYHGDEAAGPHVFRGSIYPNLDNWYTLGHDQRRFSALYATNGIIQSSDKNLKTDITELPLSTPIVEALSPVTYKWIDGGISTFEEVEEEQEVQETTDVEIVEQVIEVRNGIPTQVTKKSIQKQIVYEDHPIVDEGGEVILDSQGNLITYKIPKIVKKMVLVKKPVSHPGQRTHWGFLAQDVKKVFDDLGMDFGGYVKTENGEEGIRPDQLISVLWKSVQELTERVKKLESK